MKSFLCFCLSLFFIISCAHTSLKSAGKDDGRNVSAFGGLTPVPTARNIKDMSRALSGETEEGVFVTSNSPAHFGAVKEEEENPFFKIVAFHNEQAALFRQSADKELKLAHRKLSDGDISGVDRHLQVMDENIRQAKEHLRLSAQAINKARGVIR